MNLFHMYKKSKRRNRIPTNKPGHSGSVRAYNDYKHNATKRKISFDLTLEQFRVIITKPCIYCHSTQESFIYAASSGMTSEGLKLSKFSYTGIDRKNSTIGYTWDNCVPCCKICNRGKQDMEYQQWIDYLDRLCYNFNINDFANY